MGFYKASKVKSLTVQVFNNDVSRAINLFKHMTAPIIKEYKEGRYYEKPSEKRRRKKKEAIRNFKKKMRMMREF